MNVICTISEQAPPACSAISQTEALDKKITYYPPRPSTMQYRSSKTDSETEEELESSGGGHQQTGKHAYIGKKIVTDSRDDA